MNLSDPIPAVCYRRILDQGVYYREFVSGVKDASMWEGEAKVGFTYSYYPDQAQVKTPEQWRKLIAQSGSRSRRHKHLLLRDNFKRVPSQVKKANSHKCIEEKCSE